MATRRAAAEDETARTAEGERKEEGNGGGPPIAPIEVYEDDVAGAAMDAARAALPEIRIGPRMGRVGCEARASLAGDPLVYQRDGRLVRIAACPTVRGRWLVGVQGTPSIQEWTPTTLRAHLTERATWLKRDERSKKWKEAVPPDWVAPLLLEGASHDSPILVGVQTAPTLRPDGSLLDDDGYDSETGLYYVGDAGLKIEVPARLTDGDARVAVRVLLEPFEEFPFEDPWDRSAVLALVLALCGRLAIPGPCPLTLITGNAPGAGKSLLADVASLIAYGRKAPRMALGKDDEETRKRLTTIALLGLPFALLDNVETFDQEFGSPALDAALTAEVWQDRMLGANRMATLPMRTAWCATGNNVQIKGDLARRLVPIRLVAACERPEERTFKRPRLLEWVASERGSLLEAALVLLAAYLRAGSPSVGLAPYGSFEGWSDTVRSALMWAGEPDPCEGRKLLAAALDSRTQSVLTLLHAWSSELGNGWFPAVRVLECKAPSLIEAVTDLAAGRDGKPSARRLGTILARYVDRVLDGLVLRSRTDSHSKRSEWSVQRAEGVAGSAGSCG